MGKDDPSVEPSLPGSSGPPMKRRVFLKRTLALGALLSVAGVGKHLFRGAVWTDGKKFKHLSDTEAETLARLGDVLLPPEEGFPSNESVNLVGRIDEKLGHLSEGERGDIKSLLFAFEYLAPVLGPALGTFSSLSTGMQERYVMGWMTSRLGFKRMAFRGLKQLTMLVYYTHEATWPAIGYKGTWVGEHGRGGA